MGFLKNLIRNAINEGISKGISDAVGKATESIVAPKAENLANKTAEQLDTVAEAIETSQVQMQTAVEGFSGDFDLFPKWTYSIIENLSQDAGDDYESIIITVRLTDDLVEQYQAKLSANGFSGDWQIMSKETGGKRYIVDFSFVPDSQIQYLIQK